MILMEDFLKYLESVALRRIGSDERTLTLDDTSASLLHVATNPDGLSVKVTSRDLSSQLLVLRNGSCSCEPIVVDVAPGSHINIVELLYDGACSDMQILQASSSQSSLTQIVMANVKSRCVVALNGPSASTTIDLLQLLCGDQCGDSSLRIEHNSGDCTSHSTSKCVANDRAQGLFDGLIYVAPDSQHTVANQNSRNVVLSADARVVAQPQLEIYADDVMCTHGATVGQMNQEALYYMRQRGLSDSQARKLQLEGFVADVSSRCAVESLRGALDVLLSRRLEEL